MADRYWVGGSGTWTSTSTTNWSTAAPLIFTASISGTTLTTVGSPALVAGMQLRNATGIARGTIVSGSGDTWTLSASFTDASQSMYAYTTGASAPTAADNVFFPVPLGIAYVVTMSGAIDVADFNGSVSGVTWGGNATLTIAGSLLAVSGTSLNYSGTLSFTGSGARTIAVSNGLNNPVTFNNATGVWTMSSALSTNSALTVTAGSLITNNYALGALSLNSTGALTRSISLGSSTVTLSGASPIGLANTGLTFSAGTSQINIAYATPTVSTGDVALYNVAFTNSFLGSVSISGASTWNNLSFAGYPTASVRNFTFGGNQTINGTLTLAQATSPLNRTLVTSDILGVTRTLTVASFAASSMDYDFRDIAVVGTAAPISGQRFGDCGGNSGITFSAAKTVYRVSTNSAWAYSTGWASTAGGTGVVTNFPLAQDTAVIGATAPAAAGSLTISATYPIGTIDLSARTAGATMTLTLGGNTFYGSWIGGAGVTMSNAVIFAGRGTQTITSAGKAFASTVDFIGPGGTTALNDAFTCSSTTTLGASTLNLNGYTATTNAFYSSTSGARSILFNGGNITITGSGSMAFYVSGALTLSGTPTINFTYSGNVATTISAGSWVDGNTFDFNIKAGTYTISPGGALGNLNFTGFSGTLQAGARTIYGGLTLSPTMTINTGPTSTQTFAGSSGTGQITCNGKAIPCPISFATTGRTWKLMDALSTSYATSLTSGTLDLNGKTLTCPSFTSSGTIARNLTFNEGTLAISGTGLCATFNGSGFTSTAGSAPGQLSFTGASAKSMIGGGLSFACALNQGNGGTLTLNNGNYTFDNITASYRPATISLPANYTTTVNNFTLNGIAGSLVTLNSTIAGSRASLSKSSGAVAVNYLSIKDISATGGATWTNNLGTNGGNNLGWTFTAIAIAALNGNFFSFF